jgi:hypothetical protein
MMATLLLNGCSYTHGWCPNEWFKDYNIENIAECGGSNQRAFRTTVEWISNHGNPDFIIIGLTFDRRNEMVCWGAGPKYQKYSSVDQTPENYKKIITDFMAIEDGLSVVDKLFLNIIIISGFLRSLSIPHLFFNTCENYDFSYFEKYPYLKSKINLINQNNCIIDLKFIGNQYLNSCGATSDDLCPDIKARHYRKSDYHILEKYLNPYRVNIEQEFKKISI